MKVCFGCVIAPQERGETPIADVRKVLARISPSIRKTFEQKKYMLVRNFSEHLSLPWRASFKVSTKEELEEYCRKARIKPEWTGDEHLRTRQVRPAIATHPHIQEQVWFNHAVFFHVESLGRAERAALGSLGEDELPFNTLYGSGAPIEPETIAGIRAAYEQATVAFDWRAGDVLMLDNMLAAHGREPFVGPRKIVVSMAEPFGG